MKEILEEIERWRSDGEPEQRQKYPCHPRITDIGLQSRGPPSDRTRHRSAGGKSHLSGASEGRVRRGLGTWHRLVRRVPVAAS